MTASLIAFYAGIGFISLPYLFAEVVYRRMHRVVWCDECGVEMIND